MDRASIMRDGGTVHFFHFQDVVFTLLFYSLGTHNRRKCGRFPTEGASSFSSGSSNRDDGIGYLKENSVALGTRLCETKCSVLYTLSALP